MVCYITISIVLQTKKKAEAPQKTIYNSKKIIHTVSKIELINLIKSELNDPSHQTLDMNKVNITYHNLFFENWLNINEICENYKKQLKTLIQENIPCAKFVKSKYANQPEKNFTEEAQREAIHKSSIDQTQDINLNYMWKVARFIRKEIIDRDQWVFTGTFNDFENPPMLHTLLKWILLGMSNHVENKTRRKGIDSSISVACQYINQSTKTSKQVNYKPQKNVTRNRKISSTVDSALNVGTGIYIH